MWNSEAWALGLLLAAPRVSACSKAHAGARTVPLALLVSSLAEWTDKCAKCPRAALRSGKA